MVFFSSGYQAWIDNDLKLIVKEEGSTDSDLYNGVGCGSDDILQSPLLFNLTHSRHEDQDLKVNSL